jgi:hypothetical protein
MSSCGRATIILAAGLLGLAHPISATQIIDDDPIDKSGPHVDQIARDLVGTNIIYAVSGNGLGRADSAASLVWTVKTGDLKRLEIIARFQGVKKGDYVNRIDEVHARVTLAGREERIEGPVALLYMQTGEQWRMVYAGPRDGDRYHDFSFARVQTRSGRLIAGESPPDTATGASPFAPAEVIAPWDSSSSRIEQAAMTDDPSGPQADQIGCDLIGRNFTYFLRGSDPKSNVGYMIGVWNIEPGGVENVRIVGRYPNLKSNFGDVVYEVQALVTLAGRDETIRGVMAFQYQKRDRGWKLWAMGPRDGDEHHDFSFERTRHSDGKRTVELTPANPPAGPWRFAPKPTFTGPAPTSGSVIMQMR